jgi:hypothetical protein
LCEPKILVGPPSVKRAKQCGDEGFEGLFNNFNVSVAGGSGQGEGAGDGFVEDALIDIG